jgi:endonuclease-3
LRKSKPSTAKTAGASKRAAAYDPLAPERVRTILEGLDRMYPDVTSALTHRSAWELVVATILSAQCTDVRVNMVTPVLFAKYPTVQHFAALEPEELRPTSDLPASSATSQSRSVGELASVVRLAVPCRRQWRTG